MHPPRTPRAAALAALHALLLAGGAGCGDADDAPAAPVPGGADAQGASDAPQRSWPPTAKPDLVEELRRAHRRPRSSSDGGGSARLVLADGEQASVRVGERRRWHLRYEAGPEGIAVGGFVRLTVPRFWDWSPAQDAAPEYVGYTTAHCDAQGVELEAVANGNLWLEWHIGGRALAEGEAIEIVYGAGPALAVADKYAEHGSPFWIAVDGDGDGNAVILPDSPTVDVLAGPAARIRLVLPSTAEPGDEVPLHVTLLDVLGNAGVEHAGTVELAVIPDGLELPESLEIEAGSGGHRRLVLRTGEPGVYRVLARVMVDGTELLAQSNPLLVERNVAPVRWGDLHGHSNLSDGTGSPEDFLRYARDVAALDVVSLTDHDHWGMLPLDENPALWDAIKEVTNRFYEPGSFVTVVGYEWTNWIHGHRHVLYFGDDGPLYSSIDEAYETPAQLWDALRGKPAMTFAHHSAGGPVATDWSYPPDPVLEPVTEVASVHGNSEAPDAPYRIYGAVAGNFVRDVLDRGHRLGFIGSSDSHDGHPGLAQLASPAGSGLAAFLTDELTREGIRRALVQRRCYATNGERILLRCALDGNPMGREVPPSLPDSTALLYVRAVGTAPIAGIEVIRNGGTVAALEGEGHWDVTTSFDLEALRPGDYVYVRVIQVDRGTAWSSPFFVTEAEDSGSE